VHDHRPTDAPSSNGARPSPEIPSMQLTMKKRTVPRPIRTNDGDDQCLRTTSHRVVLARSVVVATTAALLGPVARAASATTTTAQLPNIHPAGQRYLTPLLIAVVVAFVVVAVYAVVVTMRRHGKRRRIGTWTRAEWHRRESEFLRALDALGGATGVDQRKVMKRLGWNEEEMIAVRDMLQSDGKLTLSRPRTTFGALRDALGDENETRRDVLKITARGARIANHEPEPTGGHHEYHVGQAAAVGPNAHAHDMIFTQEIGVATSIPDPVILAAELERLRLYLRSRATEPEHDAALGILAQAELKAKDGDGEGAAKELAALKRLRSAGRWVFTTATAIGTGVAAAVLKNALGL
jgi:hypothetical protein